MTEQNDQQTLQDLLRVINEMRAEQKDMRAEQREMRAEQKDLRSEVNDLRGEMNARFEKQDSELAAIRKVLDEDTATSREVESLGDKLALVQTDVVTIKEQTRETAGQLRRLQSRIDRAGVPAE